jgi:hypothetical protein
MQEVQTAHWKPLVHSSECFSREGVESEVEPLNLLELSMGFTEESTRGSSYNG